MTIKKKIFLILVWLFFLEVLIMLFLEFVRPLPFYWEPLFDASVLSLLFLPALYYLFWKPLALKTAESKQAVAALRESEKVRENLSQEKVLKEASEIFLTGGKPDLNRLLEILGQNAAADRACIFRIRQGGKVMDLTHEWRRTDDLPPLKDALRNVPAGRYAGLIRRLREDACIHIDDTDDLPAALGAMKEHLQSLRLQSLLAFPVKSWEGELLGFICFENIQHKKEWTRKTEYILRSAVQMLSVYFTRKYEERILRESEEKFRSVTETASDTIIVADREGKIVSWNNAATRMFGYTVEEAAGRHLTMLMPERFRQEHEAGIKRYEKEKPSRVLGRNLELAGLKKNGREFPLELSISTWEAGRERFFCGIIRDITEKKARETEIQKKNRELQKALDDLKKAQKVMVRQEKLASIGTLSAGVAHEILNPLNVISTIVQVLQKTEPEPGEMGEDLQEIMTQVARAAKITDNLRIFSRARQPEIKAVDLHALFDRTAELVEHDMKLDNISIERRYDEDLPSVQADDDQLAQVFLNLLNNARQAMKGTGNGTITVATRGFPDRVEFRFSDNGPGIPREILDRIFDPFFTTKDPGEGTGLGLSLVHSIIEKHGGSIEAQSGEGEGAAFILTLPVKQAGDPQKVPEERA